jgi:hypothetical protein
MNNYNDCPPACSPGIGEDGKLLFKLQWPFVHVLEPTLTVENVAGVMEKATVERRKEVWSRWDIVPGRQLEEIYQKYSTEEQRIHACADIYVNCHPDSSWTHLCKGLYVENEMTAARKAKTFIPQTGEWSEWTKYFVADVLYHIQFCV